MGNSKPNQNIVMHLNNKYHRKPIFQVHELTNKVISCASPPSIAPWTS